MYLSRMRLKNQALKSIDSILRFPIIYLGNKSLCELCNSKAYRKKTSKVAATDDSGDESDGIYTIFGSTILYFEK